MPPEVDIFSKSLQAGGLGLVALLLWILYRIFGPWVAAKIEGEKLESKARVEALGILSASLKESAQAFQLHEVADERRHGALLLHVEQTAHQTRNDVRNALMLFQNNEKVELLEPSGRPVIDREETDPGRRRTPRRGGG